MAKYISWSPIRRLMKERGASQTSRDALDQLIEYLERSSEEITSAALRLAKNSGRKKVTREDIEQAMKLI